MIDWKIYYGDGSVFSNQDGPPKKAPVWNVQDIMQRDAIKGKYHQSGSDFYIFRKEDKRWYGVDYFGLIDFLVNTGIVKIGRTIPTDRFLEIRKKADEDPDFK